MQPKEIVAAINANRGIFVLSLLGAFALLSITADIILLPELSINPFLEPVRVVLVGVIAGLMAIHTTAYAMYRSQMRSSCVGGFGISFFTSACLVCQPLWLIALGLGGATAFLAKLATPLMIVSIGLLSYSLLTFKTTCEVKK